jgi:hypothetical protein
LRRLDLVGRDEDPYLVYVRWGQYYATIGNLRRAEKWYRKAMGAVPNLEFK